MTHRNVETILGRLLTDATLRRRFAEDPTSVLEEFRTEGHELSGVELEALAATDRPLWSVRDAVGHGHVVRVHGVSRYPQPRRRDRQPHRGAVRLRGGART